MSDAIEFKIGDEVVTCDGRRAEVFNVAPDGAILVVFASGHRALATPSQIRHVLPGEINLRIY